MKPYYQMSKTEVLQHFSSGFDGLLKDEAANNQKKYGKNELEGKEKKSLFFIFLEQFKDLLILILLGAALISALLGDFKSFFVITAVVTMNAILGTVQQKKAESSLNALKQLSCPNAKVKRDGKMIRIPSTEVTRGDIVLLEAGDSVCADGRVLECAALQVNESALTGESVSVDKICDSIDEDVVLAEQKNMVHSGSFVTYGHGSFLVTEIGMNTEVGKIASMLKNAKETKTPLQMNMDQFGKKLSFIILGICGVIFFLSIIRGQAIMDSFMFAVALAVAAIPEALSSIITIVLSFGTQKMVKEKAIIRKLQAVEALGSVSVICSDKTGTLTQNKMTVCCLYTKDGIKKTGKKDENKTLSCQENKLVIYGMLCNDGNITKDGYIGDPTETALLEAGLRFGMDFNVYRKEYKRVNEIPFDSERKLMTTVHETKDNMIVVTKGAVDVLIHRMNLTAQMEQEILEKNQYFSSLGLRVLAVGEKSIESESEKLTEDNLEFVGLIAMMDPPREESKSAVTECKKAGIRPVMITGDHKLTASAIAKEIGILEDGDKAVDGVILDSFSDEELKEQVKEIAVYARVTPEHKIRIVKAWQDNGKIVAMTGDGVNDAPALKQANIGVAMGITGTEVSKDAAAMVLSDDNFSTIVKAVENGRNIYNNIKRSIQFLLSGNAAGIFMVLYASLFNLPVPFLPVHLLFINLLTDSLPAIALGLEPHKKGVMTEKPREKDESILTKDFLARVATEGFVICIATIIGYQIGLQSGIPGHEKTMAFATLCLSRLFHGFHCKSEQPVIGAKEMFTNKYLIGAFLIGVLLQSGVLFLPGISSIFEVNIKGISDIIWSYLLAFGAFLVNQGIKAMKNN